ncbi:hypothetical protein DUNSADRAFT_5276 [Dunaliella salina]|uniref:Uncharacterized protein n=1 Tax=Dunaliella salina TaxID=3046 RepID=A0ABQ7GQJ7_DUNSA|nr:hypothetical protein DUNSADRAFT_5276 [Dunaliella salina]|eukprot:KAF5836884.1 hypothetical protein DUNSADRAFT_5276 [Dunaliella salina]
MPSWPTDPAHVLVVAALVCRWACPLLVSCIIPPPPLMLASRSQPMLTPLHPSAGRPCALPAPLPASSLPLRLTPTLPSPPCFAPFSRLPPPASLLPTELPSTTCCTSSSPFPCQSLTSLPLTCQFLTCPPLTCRSLTCALSDPSLRAACRFDSAVASACTLASTCLGA